MGRNNNRKQAKTSDEINAILAPLKKNIREAWADSVIQAGENQLQMLQEDLHSTKKPSMRSKTRRRKKRPDTPHIKKLHNALEKGTSGKKDDIENAIKGIFEFDKKYRPDTRHDLTIKRTVKNILGVEKLSHKFTYSAQNKKDLSEAFETIATELRLLYPEITTEESENNSTIPSRQENLEKGYKHIPNKIRGEHLVARYESR